MSDAAEKENETKTYIVSRRHDDDLRITIPANWRVTYAPVFMGKASGSGYGGGEQMMALRFYESESKQRALFRNVISFYEESIPIQRKVKTVKKDEKLSSDSKGNKKGKQEVEVSSKWEDA